MVRSAKPTLPEEIKHSVENPVGMVRNSANRDKGSVAEMTDDDDDETDFSMTKRHLKMWLILTAKISNIIS